jgi:acetyl-CoA carboxylase alpha subunit
LFKDAAKAPRAAEASRLTAEELLKLHVADEIVPEPAGGAHTDAVAMAVSLRDALVRNLGALTGVSAADLIQRRYARFRAFGCFGNGTQEQ